MGLFKRLFGEQKQKQKAILRRFDGLIEKLADAQWEKRPRGPVAYSTETAFQAKEELISAGHPAVPSLINCLADPGPYNQRALAAKILGEIGSPDAVPILIKMLKDKEVTVRGYSAEALGVIGDKRAIGPLRQLQGNPREHSHVTGFAKGALSRLEGG